MIHQEICLPDHTLLKTLYKEFDLEFNGSLKDSLLLSIIRIKPDKDVSITINKTTILTDTSASIINMFPNKDYNYYEENFYGSSLYGITFYIDTTEKIRKLKEISVHNK